jgi:hypothetical protein
VRITQSCARESTNHPLQKDPLCAPSEATHTHTHTQTWFGERLEHTSGGGFMGILPRLVSQSPSFPSLTLFQPRIGPSCTLIPKSIWRRRMHGRFCRLLFRLRRATIRGRGGHRFRLFGARQRYCLPRCRGSSRLYVNHNALNECSEGNCWKKKG